MNKIKNRKGIIGIAALTLALVASMVMPLTATPVEAHMPGAKPPPEFELEPIVITDGGGGNRDNGSRYWRLSPRGNERDKDKDAEAEGQDG